MDEQRRMPTVNTHDALPVPAARMLHRRESKTIWGRGLDYKQTNRHKDIATYRLNRSRCQFSEKETIVCFFQRPLCLQNQPYHLNECCFFGS